MSLLAELKRRNVIRMAGLYLAGAWLVVQVAGTLLPVFEAPAWFMKALVGLLAVGFVPALVFAWVFELTPEGLKRDAEVRPEESIGPQTARRPLSAIHGLRGTRTPAQRMDRTIIVLLALALMYFAFDKLVLAPRREASLVATTTQAVRAEAGAQTKPDVDRKSVAVLPFVNMSGDPKNEFFSDGITEEILNALAQIADLKVAARTSAFAFKGKDPDLRKVGEILAVATVLEGSVQTAGDDVRITAQLIDARNGYHLWSEKYDRKLTNIFAIEDEISKAIASKLQSRLGVATAGAGGRTTNPQAYEQYLRGLSLLAARGPAVREAAEAFGQAVKLDPDYAQAWGALAETEMVVPAYVAGASMADALPLAQSAAERALAIAPGTASAHVALGEIHAYRRQWPQAEQAFQQALALAPGDAEAVNQYAQFLSETGQNEAALLQIDRAHQLDPLSAIIDDVRAIILMALHRDDLATAQLEATIAAHPDFRGARSVAWIHYAGLGRFADAETQVRAFAKIVGFDPDDLARLVRGMADPAQRAAALQQFESYLTANPADDEPLLDAIMLALLGDHDGAVARIEAFVGNPGNFWGGLLWSRAIDSLRDDPRFMAALKKMNLPHPTAAGTTR